MKSFPLFHLAFPVDDIAQAKEFYLDGLGCKLGRESKHALILNFFGNQVVGQLVSEKPERPKSIYPRHFGVIFETLAQWEQLKDRAEKKGLKFYQPGKVRNPGEAIEHYSFFLEDPSHNLLEFKYYTHLEAIFEEQGFAKVGEEVR